MQDGILEWTPQLPDMQHLRDRLRLDEDSDPDDLEQLEKMLREAQTVARPRAMCRVTPIEAKGPDWVELAGVRITSALVGQKLADQEICVLSIATCGPELGAWAQAYKADVMLQFWADEIMLAYLGEAIAGLDTHMKTEIFNGTKYARLSPGSLKEWPISGQGPLFRVLGAQDDGKGGLVSPLGVRLTPSFLMMPEKSVSSLSFLNDTGYVNCAYCPRLRCPNRRVPYTGQSTLS